MSPFTVLVLSVQACLIQSVMSNCGCGQSYGNYGYNLGGIAVNNNALNLNALNIANAELGAINVANNNALSGVGAGSCSQYGGSGSGQVGAAGDVAASGSTVVVGSVPVLGAVDFSGLVPAKGTVSISGQCGCQCN